MLWQFPMCLSCLHLDSSRVFSHIACEKLLNAAACCSYASLTSKFKDSTDSNKSQLLRSSRLLRNPTDRWRSGWLGHLLPRWPLSCTVWLPDPPGEAGVTDHKLLMPRSLTVLREHQLQTQGLIVLFFHMDNGFSTPQQDNMRLRQPRPGEVPPGVSPVPPPSWRWMAGALPSRPLEPCQTQWPSESWRGWARIFPPCQSPLTQPPASP